MLKHQRKLCESLAGFTAAALGFSPFGLGFNTRCLTQRWRSFSLSEALLEAFEGWEARGLQLQQRARSPGPPLPPARPFKLLPVTAHTFCYVLITNIKAIFGAFLVRSGWVVPAARGWLRFPPAAAAPDSAGKRREGKGEARRRKRRAGPAGKPSGAQEQHAGRGPGRGSGSALRGLEKARRGKGGSCSPPSVPLGAAAGPSEGWEPPLPARAVCSELGAAGSRRKEPVLKCGSRDS